ncbi:hypothetical protein P5673_005504 [Acropora cervicornis]|uniref:DNA2/NAM7 helicase-like C-terminal domain-containing protein n=1 Tax=Acropora cervicornis TaxID=6130 RepID=A0AAD9VD62_ACRCE|nr:hypothetical protein P5673_005504 [Acropora cervicornis]
MPQDQIVNGNADNQQWLANHLGFLTDERQMNVALTRAKHGLGTFICYQFIVCGKASYLIVSDWVAWWMKQAWAKRKRSSLDQLYTNGSKKR